MFSCGEDKERLRFRRSLTTFPPRRAGGVTKRLRLRGGSGESLVGQKYLFYQSMVWGRGISVLRGIV